VTWHDGAVPIFARYVALGDSQTEGLNDPDGVGGFRGWADRFAELVATTSPDLHYANLAVRGLLVGQIRQNQLTAAVGLRPDLATVLGGLNDMLRPSFDQDAVLGDLDTMLTALTDAGAVTLTCTFPDIAEVAPLFRRLAPRVRAYNAGVRSVAAARNAIVVDFAAHGVGSDLRLWSPDRIHANPDGHALIAAAFAHGLGLPGFDEEWTRPLPPGARRGSLGRAGTELRWVGGTVLPWAVRRARGRSSGDGRVAKRPELTPVCPA
jgi:lysophospholipase L1-like esterase